MIRKAFLHANVIDVLNDKILPDTTIFVEDGKITAMDSGLQPEGALAVDLQNAYVCPGLFNVHVHCTKTGAGDQSLEKLSEAQRTILAINNLATYIRDGVTFIRDVGCQGMIALDLRDAVKDGRIPVAPDMVVAGRGITMTGGSSYMSAIEADGTDECRKAARQLLKAGVDWIKLFATGGVCTPNGIPGAVQLDVEEMAVVVHEAHKVGVKVCVHAENPEGICNSLLAGVDCIEHGDGIDDKTLGLFKQTGAWFVPTLASAFDIVSGAGQGVPEEFVQKAAELAEASLGNFRKAFDAGVPCACGTDCGTPFCFHTSSSKEPVIMVERCGLTPYQALRAATFESARLLGVEQELGSIEEGKKAHFAVYQNNPIEDIHHLLQCDMTIKNGEILWKR